MEAVYEKYFRDNLPHIWCAGCGNGIVMSAFARAMETLGYDQDEVYVVSGIGCSSRMSGYLDFHSIHTAHGRALAFATGVKFAEPRLKVFVIMGDGDAAAIGGNHFIHACRRNIDITTIVINNSIYGMTGGQFSPLTPKGAKATTAPFGNIDRAFDMVDLARGAGATYVARGDVYHAAALANQIVKAAQHTGFSVLEVLATCPVSYGRRNGQPEPIDMLNYLKEHTVSIAQAAKLSPEQLAGKMVVGEHVNIDNVPEYTAEYRALLDSLRKDGDQ